MPTSLPWGCVLACAAGSEWLCVRAQEAGHVVLDPAARVPKRDRDLPDSPDSPELVDYDNDDFDVIEVKPSPQVPPKRVRLGPGSSTEPGSPLRPPPDSGRASPVFGEPGSVPPPPPPPPPSLTKVSMRRRIQQQRLLEQKARIRRRQSAAATGGVRKPLLSRLAA
jgi:hypothetical protein